jgi:hypothetical protein
MANSSRILFRNKREVVKRIQADGGYFRIMLKLDENDAEKLGQLRDSVGERRRRR